MAKKMLIDATHPEETRVVVLNGKRIEEFDFETATRKPLKGNIYLAKVTRVEPSLQAAFIEYGGNRHGFLAFGEIHPDYYQIPVDDRRALMEAMAAEEAEAEAAETAAEAAAEAARSAPAGAGADIVDPGSAGRAQADEDSDEDDDEDDDDDTDGGAELSGDDRDFDAPAATLAQEGQDAVLRGAPLEENGWSGEDEGGEEAQGSEGADAEADAAAEDRSEARRAGGPEAVEPGDTTVETVGSEDALEELPRRSQRSPSYMRRYKIQEVIKRRQILLVQVVKEERGNKGAALTTYLSLAGRYCVLMPNTARGGGISRKITNSVDRKRLKAIATELEVPEGMGLIVRTAGAKRNRSEVKRDFEYLLRQWESIRDLTLRSTAPCLIYEEGSLIKRAIRDLYNRDIDTVLVEGDDAYRDAKAFMRMLMPSHAKNVQQYKDIVPLLHRHQVEAQLDSMFNPVVTLPSGGYIVINPTEALVSIDVNSGRSTREHSIEDTALKTNLEAAEEIARQLRLRDLAGLIVIDFIDMEENRHDRAVERRLKESLKNDRARIQVGRISPFGLLEMSRQRLRSSVFEGSMVVCDQCSGTGHVRSIESSALRVLRACEEEAIKGKWAELAVSAPLPAALYLLNHKRAILQDLELRYGLTVMVTADPTAVPGTFTLKPGAELTPEKREAVRATVIKPETAFHEAEIDETGAEDGVEEAEADLPEEIEAVSEEREGGASEEDRPRRRRRRRRGRRGESEGESRAGSAETGRAGIEQAEQALRELLAAHPAFVGHGRVRIGTPADEIVAEAREQRASLVVMGAVSRGRLERWIVGSTAEGTLDRLACNVLVVKPVSRTQ
ncbi:MAG: Rne/Rng family ribonuclease [Alphaproteobacteria bacterium]|nr:Rne/Rng family ribonuclease [Alphaproteobacteria bacterium]